MVTVFKPVDTPQEQDRGSDILTLTPNRSSKQSHKDRQTKYQGYLPSVYQHGVLLRPSVLKKKKTLICPLAQ